MRMMHRLAERGLDVQAGIFDVEDAVREIENAIKKRQGKC